MKIFFAIPMYRGTAHPKCAEALEQTTLLLRQQGHEVLLGLCAGCCYVQFARNLLVRQFLDSDCDTLFFLDDDVSWKAEDALRLIEMEDAVVAGVYPIKKDEESYPVVIFTDPDDRPVVREDGCISAAGVPAGFLRIKRQVIEKLYAEFPQNRYYDFVDGVRRDDLCDLFPQGVRDGRWWGEDFAFCHLWRSLLGEIWVVPNLTFGHHAGEAVWTGNYHEFLLRQPGGSEAQ